MCRLRDFGTSDLKCWHGETDLFITKINADLTYGWTCAEDHGETFDEPYAVAVDPFGNVYVTGANWAVLGIATPNHIFIKKLNPDGSDAWSKRLIISKTQRGSGSGIAADLLGNVFVAGDFSGTVDFGSPFGTTDIKTASDYDGFVLKIKAEGTYAWTKTMGGTSSDYRSAVSTDAAGNAFVKGGFSGTVDFAQDFGSSDSKTSAGNYDVFLTKLDLLQTDYTTPRHAVGDFDHDAKDEVALDFGAAGIWLYDQGNWTQLAPENPESLMAGNIGNGLELLADLGSQGLWR